MARRRGLNAGQCNRRWVSSCRWCPQELQEFFFRFFLYRYEDKRRLWRGSKVGTVDSRRGREGPDLLRKPKKSGKRENYVRDFVSRWRAGCLIFAMTGVSELGTSAKKNAPVLANKSASSLARSPVWLRCNGRLVLHERKGNRKGPKYPWRTLVEETP